MERKNQKIKEMKKQIWVFKTNYSKKQFLCNDLVF